MLKGIVNSMNESSTKFAHGTRAFAPRPDSGTIHDTYHQKETQQHPNSSMKPSQSIVQAPRKPWQQHRVQVQSTTPPTSQEQDRFVDTSTCSNPNTVALDSYSTSRKYRNDNIPSDRVYRRPYRAKARQEYKSTMRTSRWKTHDVYRPAYPASSPSINKSRLPVIPVPFGKPDDALMIDGRMYFPAPSTVDYTKNPSRADSVFNAQTSQQSQASYIESSPSILFATQSTSFPFQQHYCPGATYSQSTAMIGVASAPMLPPMQKSTSTATTATSTAANGVHVSTKTSTKRIYNFRHNPQIISSLSKELRVTLLKAQLRNLACNLDAATTHDSIDHREEYDPSNPYYDNKRSGYNRIQTHRKQRDSDFGKDPSEVSLCYDPEHPEWY